MSNDIPPKKPLKDIDSVERAQFLRIAAIIFKWALFALPYFIYKWGWLGFVLWLLLCLTLSIVIEYVTDFIGSTAGSLYGGPKSDWNIREQLRGSLDIARVQKMNGNYDAALTQVEEILLKDPAFAEALYAKAQILYEGYGNKSESIQCLEKILHTIRDSGPVNQWAWSLKKKIESGATGASNVDENESGT